MLYLYAAVQWCHTQKTEIVSLQIVYFRLEPSTQDPCANPDIQECRKEDEHHREKEREIGGELLLETQGERGSQRF